MVISLLVLATCFSSNALDHISRLVELGKCIALANVSIFCEEEVRIDVINDGRIFIGDRTDHGLEALAIFLDKLLSIKVEYKREDIFAMKTMKAPGTLSYQCFLQKNLGPSTTHDAFHLFRGESPVGMRAKALARHIIFVEFDLLLLGNDIIASIFNGTFLAAHLASVNLVK